MTGEARNINYVITMQCSAGKLWALGLRSAACVCYFAK